MMSDQLIELARKVGATEPFTMKGVFVMDGVLLEAFAAALSCAPTGVMGELPAACRHIGGCALAANPAASAQPVAEPDGYLEHTPRGDFLAYGVSTTNPQTPLYTLAKARAIFDSPPTLPADVGMTEAEIDEITFEHWGKLIAPMVSAHRIFARAIIAAMKAKGAQG